MGQSTKRASRKDNKLLLLPAAIALLIALAFAMQVVYAGFDNAPMKAQPQTPSSAVLFSIDLPDTPTTNWSSCIIGLFGGPGNVPLVHHWKVLSRMATNIEVIISADTVNTAETGDITATLTDNVGVQTVTVTHPSTAGGTSMPLALTLTPGVIYDLTITNNLDGAARHYRVGAKEVDVELGWEESLLYPEPGRNDWAINVGTGENVELVFYVDNPGSGDVPNQATSIEYAVAQLSGPDLVQQTTSAISSGSPITVNFTSSTQQTLILKIDGNGHYRIKKTTGIDNGFYARPCPPPSDQKPKSCRGPEPAGGTIIYVDWSSTSGTPDRSAANPYVTIQDAVNAASGPSTIHVAQGVYMENITISTSGIHLIGSDPGAAAIIDASPGIDAIIITQSVNNVTIQNFRIEAAQTQGGASGIIIYGSSEPRGIEICNNVLFSNDRGVSAQDTSPLVVNNTFVLNSNSGVNAAVNSNAIIRNNIFQQNGDGVRSNSAGITIDHNLFWINTADLGGTAACTTGCVFGMDPLLANVPGQDFHLSIGSPAIDVGSGLMAPGQHIAAVPVHDGYQVQEATGHGYVCDVSHPHLINSANL